MTKPVLGQGFPLKVNYQQGTLLLNRTGMLWPDKFTDEKKFGIDVRSTFTRNGRQAFKAIKKVSPGFQQRPKMLPLFGDPKNWRAVPWPTDKDGKVPAHLKDKDPEYEILDYYKTETLYLNAQARDFVSSVLYYLTDPDCKECMSAMMQEENIWSIAEQLVIVPWLEKKIGLNGIGGIQVEYGAPSTTETDQAPAAEEDAGEIVPPIAATS